MTDTVSTPAQAAAPSPAASPSPAPAATQSPASASSPAPAATPSPAPAGFQLSADDTAYIDSLVTNRGYDKAYLDTLANDPQGYKMLTTMREQHKLLGTFQSGDKIVLPKDPNDKAAWDAVYTKLGRPPAPTDYKIEIPEGADSTYATEAAKAFHAIGLSQQQAEALAKWNNEFANNYQKANTAQLAAKAAEEIDAVQKEWGADSKINGELAARGLNQTGNILGWPADKVEAIKEGHSVTLSAGEALKLWKFMGDHPATRSQSFEGADSTSRTQSGGGLSPQGAVERINLLRNDRAFYQRLVSKDANAVKEWDELHKIAAR